MNTLKLLSEILAQELSPESIFKLNELRVHITANKENKLFAELSDAVMQDKMIKLIFSCAKKRQRSIPDAVTPDYMNNREIMAALGISRRTLAEWRASGILTFTLYRNNYYYRVEDLKKLLEENYNGAAPYDLPTNTYTGT